MTTIGDSFSIVALLVGIGITAWALILCMALLFPRQTNVARNAFDGKLGRTFWVGLAGFVPAIIGLLVLNAPAPLLKLVGLMMLLGTLAVAMLGLAGLVTLVAGRIRTMEPNLSVYGSLVRANALLVVGAFFPFLGWLFVAPILLVLGLGAGFRSLAQKAADPAWELK